MARLRTIYQDEIVPKLREDFGYSNPHEIPKIEKISVNMGLGEAVANPKIIDGAVKQMATLTGQKPIVTRARKSIANYKLREGMPIGCKVTLRRERMYEFLDRLLNVALPRVRDFRGVSPRAFDGRGNYSIGIREQIIFPEIDYDAVDKILGLNVTIVTSAKTDDESRRLLSYFGMPFRK
ncbi:MAG: 50S ribosomal protein L5 [Myxococcota bacterium]|jgi:large subunit ribosomal protein L5|nr:50S ribosomal protein L5 [Myxococcota bacterium]